MNLSTLEKRNQKIIKLAEVVADETNLDVKVVDRNVVNQTTKLRVSGMVWKKIQINCHDECEVLVAEEYVDIHSLHDFVEIKGAELC